MPSLSHEPNVSLIFIFKKKHFDFSAIFYNVALNIKQDQSESELDSLRMTLNTHKELFVNVSSDLVEISDKIKVVEVDLESVKASNKDIDELKKIHNKLLDYASKINFNQKNAMIEETKALYVSSGGGSSFLSKAHHDKEILAIFIVLLKLKSIFI